MKTGDRLDRLERAISIHLEESGEIRQDIKWLKKFLWFVVASPWATEVLKHLWH
jgi:hypothetical protein